MSTRLSFVALFERRAEIRSRASNFKIIDREAMKTMRFSEQKYFRVDGIYI